MALLSQDWEENLNCLLLLLNNKKYLHTHLVQLILHCHQKFRQIVTHGSRLCWVRSESFTQGRFPSRPAQTSTMLGDLRFLQHLRPTLLHRVQQTVHTCICRTACGGRLKGKRKELRIFNDWCYLNSTYKTQDFF